MLTDVDLFSSYGLTNKATQLLENILVRAPRHTPTLERLLDFYLGAGDDRRTAEMAAQLELIHRERDDTVNAERFAALRERFHKAAGITEKNLHAAPAASPEPQVAAPPAAAPPAQGAPAPDAHPEFQIPLATPSEHAAPAQQPAAAEVDLSDEWEAMVQEVTEPVPAPAVQPPPPDAVEIQQSRGASARAGL